MDPQERSQFVEIVRDESERLGRRVEEWGAESADHLGADWLLADMRGEDLLTILGREVEREDGVPTSVESVESGADELWVRVDSHAIARAGVHLVARLRDQCSVGEVTLSLTTTGPAGRHAGLDVRWTGRPPDPALFKGWLDEPLTEAAAGTVREVVERHDGEVWTGAGPDGSG